MPDLSDQTTPVSKPPKRQSYDAPVEEPANDLLGFAEYARGLSRAILEPPNPQTIGIYGVWGEGKTSFVNLIRHELAALFKKDHKNEPIWVTFSTWPYTGADEVWRALMLTIFARVYDVDPSLKLGPPPEENGPTTLAEWLRWALGGNAYTLYEPPEPQTPYDELVEWLGVPAFGTISKAAVLNRQYPFDPETLWPWFVSTVLGATSGVTGLLAGLGELFKANSPQQSQSGDRVRELEQKASLTAEDGRRWLERLSVKIKSRRTSVFVFVDDLDRGAPDIALDVLDAIRFFFAGVENCTFIIAADESILGQGLLMRYREGIDLPVNGRESYEQKGREYLDKLVQFSVRVPPSNPQQSHRYIASQAAGWAVATDIIQAAVGANLRRLKQYARILSYGYEVDRAMGQHDESQAGAEDEDPDRQLFEKLFALSALRGDCLDLIAELAQGPAINYCETLRILELPNSDPAIPAPTVHPSDGLTTAFKDTGMLGQLLRSAPYFHEHEPDAIALLADIARLHPDPNNNGALEVSDPALDYIWTREVSRRSLITANDIYERQQQKLSDFAQDTTLAQFRARIGELWRQQDWRHVMRAAERAIDAVDKEQSSHENIRQVVGKKNALLGELFDCLLPGSVSTRLTDAEALSVQTLSEVWQRLQAVLLDPLPFSSFPSFPDDYLTRRLNQAGVTTPEGEGERRHRFYVERHFSVANHLWHIRSFAKLDALDRSWHRLANRYRADRDSFIEMEQALQSGQDSPKSWGHELVGNESLTRLLLLPPFYSHIPPEAAERYRAVSRQLSTAATQAQVSAPEAQPAQREDHPSRVAPATVKAGPIDTLRLHIEPVKDKDSSGKIAVRMLIGSVEFEDVREVDLSALAGSIDRQLVRLPPDTDRQTDEKRIESAGQMLAMAFLNDLEGCVTQVLPEHPDDPLSLQLSIAPSLPEAAALPWEALLAYLDRVGVQTKWLHRVIVSRRMPESIGLSVPPSVSLWLPLTPPPLWLSHLRNILGQLSRSSRTIVHEVPYSATNLQALETSGSGVVHIVGGFEFETEPVLTGLTPGEGVLSLRELGQMLAHAGTQFVVLTLFERSSSRNSVRFAEGAAALVEAGIPVVIANHRQVNARAAGIFYSPLYESLLRGEVLDDALARARRHSAREGGNWAAFGAFSSLGNLNVVSVAPS
jgi:hypothetical protein